MSQGGGGHHPLPGAIGRFAICGRYVLDGNRSHREAVVIPLFAKRAVSIHADRIASWSAGMLARRPHSPMQTLPRGTTRNLAARRTGCQSE
jgi:hypothetical protein